jgi:hypothetical protein
MVREWWHIWLLKHMGRGHDPLGIKGMKEGECAVLCPACIRKNPKHEFYVIRDDNRRDSVRFGQIGITLN